MNQQYLTVPLELKSHQSREIEGHGSIFGNVDHGGDIVVPGAFKASLSGQKARGEMPSMYWMHQPDQVAGVWREVREDEKGLYVRGELADTQLGNELRTLLKMEAVRGLSIGFITVDSDFDRKGNRLLKELDVVEVSVVSRAMNPRAKVESVKSQLSALGEYVPTARWLESHFRHYLGCSKSLSRELVYVLKADGDDRGEMPTSQRRDAEDIELAEAASALDGLMGRFLLGTIKR